MALDTSKVLLPKEVATVITKRAKDTSTIAALSPSEPQLFLDKDYMVFTGNSEAEVVAEGAQKSSYEETLTPVVGKRFKVQTTTRLSNELQWADEDAKLEIISKIQTMRKEADFEVMDRIKVTYEGSEKAEAVFEKNNTLIAGEVLADEVVKAQPDGYVKEWKINGEAVTMGVEKKGE